MELLLRLFILMFSIWAQPAPAICPGDANGDRVVNILDLSLQSAYYLQAVEPGTHGDVNHDGVVDMLDMALTANNYGRMCLTVPGLAVD